MQEIDKGSTEGFKIPITDKGNAFPLNGFVATLKLFRKDKTAIMWEKTINPIPNPELCFITFSPSKTDFDIPIDTYFLEVKIESDTERFFPIKYEQINIV